MTIITADKWTNRFLSTAKHYSTFSCDPSTKVGAVAVRDNRVVSAGWNGYPRGFDDSPQRYADRTLKYQFVVHAEKNCIYNAAREGISLVGTEMFVSGMIVCSLCALGIAQAGVKAVHMAMPSAKDYERWKDEFAKAIYIFDKSWIEYVWWSECDEGHVAAPSEAYPAAFRWPESGADAPT